MEAAHLGAEGLRQPPRLQVVRQHDGDLVSRLDQPPADQEVRLRAAGSHEDLVGRDPRIQRRDAAAEQVGAVRLAITEPHLEKRPCRCAGELEQLPDRERVDARFGQVVAHPVFPGALPALEVEGDERHRCWVSGVRCQ